MHHGASSTGHLGSQAGSTTHIQVAGPLTDACVTQYLVELGPEAGLHEIGPVPGQPTPALIDLFPAHLIPYSQ